MNKNKLASVQYVLPQDSGKVEIDAKSMAMVAVLQETLAGTVKRDRGAVEAACREALVLWQAQTAYTKPLTNDFSAFVALYIPAYAQVYLECGQRYDTEPGLLERDKREAADFSWGKMLLIARDHYTREAEAASGKATP